MLFEEAITMGITTSLNPQYDRTGQWTGLEFLSRYITVFICNEIEALSITGEVVVHQAAEILLSWGCKIVVLTSSKQSNAYVQRCCRTIIFSQPCYYLNDIVDTTGAGDAFIGAFLTEWTRHELIKWNLEHIELDLLASFVKQCLRAGNLAGACAVSVKGASSTVDGSFMATIEQCPLHDVNAAEEFGMY